MPHEASLIATVAVAMVLAFAFGFVATRLRVPPLVGYLVAGIALGPYTPGLMADAALASQLAEIGVILLMFGVGLHFSINELLAVRWIAVPGAVGQIGVATAIGAAMAMFWGWSFGAGLVLGLALSVASTVVLLRALEEQNSVATVNGRIAVGWLIVEDLAMVITLVLLPAFAGLLGGGAASVGDAHAPAAAVTATGATLDLGALALELLTTIGKIGLFVALVLLVGKRAVPWLLSQAARTGSRELFTLSVLAVALGIAYGSAQLFGVSFALGAFFAGLVLSGSDLSHRAAAESMPLQDAFAVLFFVSVGMLFDPTVLVRHPGEVLAVLGLILFGKSLAAFLIVLVIGYPLSTAVMVSASLAQIGEFSFILAGLGIALGLLPPEGRDLILAGALLSITLNPLVFTAVAPVTNWLRARKGPLARIDVAASARLNALDASMQQERAREEALAQAKVDKLIQELMAKLPMFSTLEAAQRDEVLRLFKPAYAVPGQRLIRTGDRADKAYFISEGAVEVSVAGQRIKLGPGDFFGEMALLTGAPRSADVTAIDYCKFLTLDASDFTQFINRYPAFRSAFDAAAARRGEMNVRQQQEAKTA